MFLLGSAQAFRASAKANSPETALLTPISISLLIFVIIKWVLSQDQNHAFVFAMLGMTVALIHRIEHGGDRAGRAGPL